MLTSFRPRHAPTEGGRGGTGAGGVPCVTYPITSVPKKITPHTYDPCTHVLSCTHMKLRNDYATEEIREMILKHGQTIMHMANVFPLTWMGKDPFCVVPPKKIQSMRDTVSCTHHDPQSPIR